MHRVKGLSVLSLIFGIDAVVALAKGQNMYSLRPDGSAGYALDTLTLLAVLILGPVLWRVAEARALGRARVDYQAYLAAGIPEEEAMERASAGLHR